MWSAMYRLTMPTILPLAALVREARALIGSTDEVARAAFLARKAEVVAAVEDAEKRPTR